VSRPQSASEPLARPAPQSLSNTASSTTASFAAAQLSRRSLLRGTLGAAALLGLPGVLAACGSGSSGGAAAGSPASGTVTLGSNQSDAVPKKAFEGIVSAYQAQSGGVTVATNVVDHNTFQENINNYLQGQPDDVFTWFSGFRMRFFADQGLAGDLSDVWAKISGMTDPLKAASTSTDGKQYFVPFTTYPWAVFYRPSVFAAKGYQVPKTLAEFYTLTAQMKKDSLIPLAFADKDGWPAMGTFDQLNLRINGFDYHVSLMAGKEAWNGTKVKNVFDAWRKLLEVSQPDSLGRTWQESAQAVQRKEAAMLVQGMFMGQQFTAGPDREDLDFFAFPEVDTNIGTDAIEAPIDGFMMSKRPKNEAGAKSFLTYLSTAAAQGVSVKADPTVIATSTQADTTGYTTLQKKAVGFISGAKNISQFMDRDTRPDFASTVMIPAIQTFIGKPNDVDGLVNSIESQKKTIFAS
jgi:multiple sugar transport system substrate-binding protein